MFMAKLESWRKRNVKSPIHGDAGKKRMNLASAPRAWLTVHSNSCTCYQYLSMLLWLMMITWYNQMYWCLGMSLSEISAMQGHQSLKYEMLVPPPHPPRCAAAHPQNDDHFRGRISEAFQRRSTHHSITADYYKLIYKCFLFPKSK